MSSSASPPAALKNCVVVGGSYVGLMVADELKKVLPSTHRVLVVEKNSHFGHLFAYPRFAVVGANEHKAFIPFKTHDVVRAKALAVSPGFLKLDREIELDGLKTAELPYDALVMATGTKLQAPGTMPNEDKVPNVEWFQAHQRRVKEAKRIAILGGGAVGVQMATDIATLFPDKEVTLIHSRQTVMPRFHPKLSEIVLAEFDKLGVKTVLGSRAKVPEGGFDMTGPTVVETQDGRTVEADFVILSTGQTPLSDPIKSLAPSAIQSSGFIRVKPTLQVDASGESSEVLKALERVYAAGDIADSGAPKAARPAMVQARIVASNILKQLEGSSEPLEDYQHDPAAIHLTLGIQPSIVFRNPTSSDKSNPLGSFTGEPEITWKDDGREDMGIEGVWTRRAPGVTDYHT